MEKGINKPAIIVSACLCGKRVRYDGKIKNTLSYLEKLSGKYRIIPVCPEMLGDLGLPRPQSEIKDRQVISIEGKNVTENFKKGAEETYRIFKENNAVFALLKESSPSCGVNSVYDGSFSGVKIKGEGITAGYLKGKGIKVYSEKDFILE